MKSAILILLIASALSAEYIVEWNNGTLPAKKYIAKNKDEAAAMVSSISMDIGEQGGRWWIEIRPVKPVVEYILDTAKVSK